jgi:methylglutaconyl-CoA hydratase
MNQPIITLIKDRIGYIILNRPEKRNALNSELIAFLSSALTDFERDEAVKVIVIKAEGKVFSSGADLAALHAMQSNTFEENLMDSRGLKDLFNKIYSFPKVIIAQIQGHALAGGCGLASICDFSFASSEAKFGYTEVKIGFIPAIVMVFLLRKIGEGKAKQLLLEGDLISATYAQSMGLINRVVDADELEEKVYGFAQKLIEQNSGQAMSLTKEMIGRVQERTLEEALEYAASMNAKARGTEDCKKGITAFLKKEQIKW